MSASSVYIIVFLRVVILSLSLLSQFLSIHFLLYDSLKFKEQKQNLWMNMLFVCNVNGMWNHQSGRHLKFTLWTYFSLFWALWKQCKTWFILFPTDRKCIYTWLTPIYIIDKIFTYCNNKPSIDLLYVCQPKTFCLTYVTN